MKKIVFKILSILMIGSFTTTQALAAAQDFIVRATIPPASGVTFSVAKLTANANGDITSFNAVNTTTLDFETLPFVTQNAQGDPLNIFIAPFFWAVSVGALGFGNPDVQIQYLDQANPNQGSGNNRAGLLKKGIITTFRVNQTTNQQGVLVDNPTLLTSNPLSAFTGTGVTINDETQLTSGFFRLFLGISTGAATEPSGAEPFTALDVPGVYSGTLTLTATFD